MSGRRLGALALTAMLAVSGSLHAVERRALDTTPAAANGSTAIDDARVDRLTDLVVEMAPVGKILDIVAGSDPKWPMQDDPKAVSASQLVCLRTELSSTGYRRMKREEVLEYAAQHPTRIDAEIEALGNGAAKYFGQLTLAGANSEDDGRDVDAGRILSTASPTELKSFIEIATATEYKPLRDMSGLTVILEAGEAPEGSEEETRGMMLLMGRIMLQAMETCEVPMSALPE